MSTPVDPPQPPEHNASGVAWVLFLLFLAVGVLLPLAILLWRWVVS